MDQILSPALEQYIASIGGPADALLEEVAATARLRGVPAVHDDAGRLLRILVQATTARRVLEIGTATGYSGLWIAGGLPDDGLLISIERDASRAAEARKNFERAGVSSRVSVIVGDVTRYLHKVAGPFDIVFQDGDKLLYEPLLERLLEILRPGGLLISDNVLWGGKVVPGSAAQAGQPDAHTAAIAAYNRRLAADARLSTMILPVGDGVSLALKLASGPS